MNPSISIACDATFGAGSENFGTVTGNVTFQDGSANSGTVTGNAVFEGAAENKAGATVTGDATFGIASVNNGTVSGTVVPPSTDLSPAEGEISFTQFLQYNGSTIQQYTAGGWYNGRYAVNGQPYMTLAEAEVALAAYVLEQAYTSWLSSNSGSNQFIDFNNPHNGQWAYNGTEYANEAEARAAQAAAEAAAQQSAYQAWLAANTGVNQYTGTGAKNGQWAYNSTEYPSQAAAQEAADAASGGGGVQFGNVIFTKLRDEPAYNPDGSSMGNYREYSWAFDVEPTGTGTVSYTMQQQWTGSPVWHNVQMPNYNTGDAPSSLQVAATDSTGTYYLSVSWPTE
jgi:hypothetical protein